MDTDNRHVYPSPLGDRILHSVVCLIVAPILIAPLIAFTMLKLPSVRDQFRTSSFPSTTGTVTDAHAMFGQSYTPTIHYDYTVNGVVYEGNRFRIDTDGLNGSQKRVRRFLSQYPVGASITVYYDAACPDSSVLFRGPRGEDTAQILLGLALGLITALGGVGIVRHMWWIHRSWTSRRLFVEESQDSMRVRLVHILPITEAIVATVVLAFAMGGSLMFFWPAAPTPYATLPLIGIIVVFGGIAYWMRRKPVSRGDRDLMIDYLTGVVTLPQTHKRKQPVTMPLDEIADVYTHKRQKVMFDATDFRTEVRLVQSNQSGRVEQLLSVQMIERDGVALGAWLLDRIIDAQQRVSNKA